MKRKTLILSIIVMLILAGVSLALILHMSRSIRETVDQYTEETEEDLAQKEAEQEAQRAEEEAAALQEIEDATIASHVYSHRGSAGAEEHSFKAYDAAIEAGSRYIEQDVVISSDGILYVSHDENAVYMTGYDGMYEYMSSETIDSLETDAGNKILRLSEVFDKYGDSVNYVIELKTNSDACVEAFEKLVDEYGLEDSIIVQSMHAGALESIENKYPDMPKLFVCWNQGDFDYVLSLPYVDIVSVKSDVETGIYNESNCKAAHDAGKLFGAWTLNTEEEIKGAIDMGVDNYFTDDTALALSIEREYGLEKRKAE